MPADRDLLLGLLALQTGLIDHTALMAAFHATGSASTNPPPTTPTGKPNSGAIGSRAATGSCQNLISQLRLIPRHARH
jgi:hypothetical protein